MESKLRKAAGEVKPPSIAPHRPNIAPALGLRAGNGATWIVSQTNFTEGTLTMSRTDCLLNLLKRSPRPASSRKSRAARTTFRPRLQRLEDRTVLSSFTAATVSDVVVNSVRKAERAETF